MVVRGLEPPVVPTREAARSAATGTEYDRRFPGYSSLAHLRHIAARQLKIDRSFVIDVTESHDARAVLKAIIQLAHALRMEVVGEGVETEAQLQALRELDCDLLQGYYIARPMPAGKVPARMATRERARRAGLDTSFDVETA